MTLSWVQHLINPQALSALFISLEGLDRLDVFEVGLNREGPIVTLRADLARFPERPSKRWPSESNRIQIQLQFLCVEGLQIAGLAASNQGTLEVVSEQGLYSFAFNGPSLTLRGQCSAIRITGVNGYLDEEL
jgi:hypothetical protein